MKTVIHCILLLACAAICTSTYIKQCRCLKNSRAVNTTLIADIRVYNPRPYCDKQEVIAIMKDRSSQCLDPAEPVTQAILRTIQRQKEQQAQRMNATVRKTTRAPASVTT